MPDREQQPEKTAYLRPEVLWFATQMEKQLRVHDEAKGKQGWHELSNDYLMNEAGNEFTELLGAIQLGDPGAIIHEAADLANIAMMLADNARRRMEAKHDG